MPNDDSKQMADRPKAKPQSNAEEENYKHQELGEVEARIVHFFVQVTKLLAMPKSVGEIYGVLFASSKPLSVAEITAKLGISKATASYALRFLDNINAISVSKVFGVRYDLFTAETSLRKLAFGFLSERVDPFVADRDGDLERLTELSAELPESDPDARERKKFLLARVKMLTGWQRNARKVLPLVRGFFKMTS